MPPPPPEIPISDIFCPTVGYELVHDGVLGDMCVGSGAARVELQTQDIRPSMRRQRLLPPLFEEDSASDESTDESEDSSAEQTDSCDSGESSSSGDDNDQLGDDRSMSPFLV